MSENKRYYWLKLNEKFFEDDTITWIEEQKNGKDYIIFYLKLCLKSLSDDGCLVRYVGERLIPYDVPALSRLTNTSSDTVAVAMKLFLDIGLINRLETGEIYMNQINEMIGSETDSAKRMRKKRVLDDTKQMQLDTPSQSDSNVHLSDTEKEKEIEKEVRRKKKESNSTMSGEPDDVSESIPYEEIIEHLNNAAGRKYKHSTDKTKSLIKARWNEGFNLEDFKSVIDKKVASWSFNDMSKYLRPETLFGTKFEGYLNEEGGNMDNGSEYDEYF